MHPTPDTLFKSHKRHFPPLPSDAQNKPNVDRAFLRQLLAILRIVFPSYRSTEIGIVLVHSTFLVLRTVLSVGVAKLDGKIVKALVCYHPFLPFGYPCLQFDLGYRRWTRFSSRSWVMVPIGDS